MRKNEIRLQYSGFIIFASQILSVLTGLAFTLLLTRSMNTDQYGIWTNIFDYTGYFMLFSGLVPFWATRFVARGQEGAIKTSTAANFILALASIMIYFPAITLIAQAIGTQQYLLIYFLTALYIFNNYMILNLEGCLRAVKPQAIGYGLLIEEVVKIAVAFAIIVGLGQLFLGAILSLTLSVLVQILYYLYLFRDEFKQRIRWGYLKEWLKGSTVILYNAVGSQLLAFVFILLFFFGGSDTRAYYQAAFTFSNIITYAASLAFALYPKLLANEESLDAEVGSSFRLVMMLAIPLSAIIMVMSTSLLTVLNIAYSVAWPALILLTIDTLIVVITTFYSTYIMGTDVFDAEGKISFGKLVRSKIFKLFSITFIQAAIALPITYIILTQTAIADPVQLVVYIIAVNIGVHVSTLLFMYAFMRNSIRLQVDWKSIMKFISSAALTALILYLLPNPTTILLTISKTALGMGIYFGTLLAIDKQARVLLRLILDEIKMIFQQLAKKQKTTNL